MKRKVTQKAAPTVPKVFISYAHADRYYLDQFLIHLKLPSKQGVLTYWFDDNIDDGEEWRKRILRELKSAHIVVMLVTPSFTASHFCYEVEMPAALRRHDRKEAKIYWTLVLPCEWKETPLAPLNGLPAHGHLLPANNPERDAFWTRLTSKLRAEAMRLKKQPAPRPKPTPTKPRKAAKRKKP